MTFRERLVLDLGDLAVRMERIGAPDSRAEIAVYVPEERLLAVGDLFYRGSAPFVSPERAGEIPRRLAVLEPILAAQDPGLRHVICGHGPPMTPEELRARVGYLRALWDGVIEARGLGLDLAETLERLTRERSLSVIRPWVEDLSGLAERHRDNVRAVWSCFRHSVADSLARALETGGIPAMQETYRRLKEDRRIRAGFSEPRLRALGSRLQRLGRSDPA